MTKVLAGRFPAHEAELIEQYVAARGISVSDLVRDTLRAELRAAVTAGATARTA